MARSALVDLQHGLEGEYRSLCFVLGLVDSEGGYDDHECHSDRIWEDFSVQHYWTLSGREHIGGPKDEVIGIDVEELERIVEAGLHGRREKNQRDSGICAPGFVYPKLFPTGCAVPRDELEM